MLLGDWPQRPLSEVVDVLDGRRIPIKASDRAARGGNIPYYGATGQAGTIDRAIFDEPLVLLGEDGAPFLDPYKSKAYLVDGPAWVNNHAHVLRPREAIDRKFLRYYLDTFDYRGYANGTTRLKLTQAAMKAIPVPVPPMDEQRRIVEILEDHLSRLDAAERGVEAAARRTSSLQGRLVADAITGATVPGPRRRQVLDIEEANDGPLPSLPVGWAWRRLGDVADVVGGVTKDASKQDDAGHVEVPYLRVANVQRGSLKLDSVSTIRVSPAKAQALKLRQGDVLLNEGGDRDKLARGWVWEDQVANCIHQNHVFRARVHQGLDPYFLSWTANTIGGRWAERNGKQSVNLASISLSMIRRMPVIVPPPGVSSAVIRELDGRLSELRRLKSAVASQADRTSNLRRALLSAAFSGRLTGRQADDEVLQRDAAANGR